MADGNLISQGVGDGAANLIAPFQPDTSLIQANWNRVDKQQAAKEAQLQANRNKAEAEKAKWDKELDDTYKYDPLDDIPMKKLHKDFNDLVANHKAGEDDRAIREAAFVIKRFAEDSKNTFKARNDVHKSIYDKGATHWIDGVEDYTAGLTPSTATELGDAAKQLAARQIAVDKVKIGNEKLKNIPEHTAKVAKNITPKDRILEPYTDPKTGQTVNRIREVYDDAELDNAARIDYQTYERDLKKFYKTEDEYVAAVKESANPKVVISAKYPPSASATTSMAGEKNKKVNMTFDYSNNGQIAGAEPQAVGGTDSKEYATAEIDGKPTKVRVENTKDGKVTITIPENEKKMDAYNKLRKKWGADVYAERIKLDKEVESENITAGQRDKALVEWSKFHPEPTNPNLTTKKELEGADAEKVWHQAYGVTLDQTYKGETPNFVRKDETLKGKTTKDEVARGNAKNAGTLYTKPQQSAIDKVKASQGGKISQAQIDWILKQ